MDKYYIEDVGRRTTDFIYVYKNVIDIAGRITPESIGEADQKDAPVITWNSEKRGKILSI